MGIGTTSPEQLLHIRKASGDSRILLESVTGGDPELHFNSEAANRNGVIRFLDNGAAAGKIIYAHNGDTMSFHRSNEGTASFTLTGGNAVFTGNVGIGTTSPSQPLTIKSDGAVSYNGATDLDGESFLRLEGANEDGEAAMIRWANHGAMNNYFGVVQVGSGGYGEFVWTSYNGTNAYAEKMRLRNNGTISATATATLLIINSAGSTVKTINGIG